MPGGFIYCCASAPHHNRSFPTHCRYVVAKDSHALSSQVIFKTNFQGGYDPNQSSNLCWCSADSSINTVAILAQGTSWAVAVTQAFCCMVQIHSGLLYVAPTSNAFLVASLSQLVPRFFLCVAERMNGEVMPTATIVLAIDML